jgi:hypothetical protein
MKCVILINKSEVDVGGGGICHSISKDHVMHINGMPPGNDCVAI